MEYQNMSQERIQHRPKRRIPFGQTKYAESDDYTMIREENECLLRNIREYCMHPDCQTPCNILLVGKNGAGKSALINSLVQVLVGKDMQRTKVGTGVAQSNTLRLMRYKNCGLKLEDVTCSSGNADVLLDVIPHLPHVFDMAGYTGVLPEAFIEILKYVIGGYIDPGTGIEKLTDLQALYGVGKFGTIFKKANPEWKITKIVFVQSCQENVDIRVIQSLRDLLKTTNYNTGQFLYDVDVFTVITKYDLVPRNKITFASAETVGFSCQSDMEQNEELLETVPDNNESITIEQFEKVENEIAKQFNIVGALKHNSIRWVSYVDKVGFKDNPYIDNIVLKFLKMMVSPEERFPIQAAQIVTWPVWFILNLRWCIEATFRHLKLNVNLNSISDDLLLVLFSICVFIFPVFLSIIVRSFSVK